MTKYTTHGRFDRPALFKTFSFGAKTSLVHLLFAPPVGFHPFLAIICSPPKDFLNITARIRRVAAMPCQGRSGQVRTSGSRPKPCETTQRRPLHFSRAQSLAAVVVHAAVCCVMLRGVGWRGVGIHGVVWSGVLSPR